MTSADVMKAALSTEARDVGFLLSNLVEQTTGVEHGIAVSSDGLVIAMSDDLDRAKADRLAAIVSGLRSLADGAARTIERGGVRLVILEMEHGYLVVSMISHGSSLGVIAEHGCDLGLVGYEVTALVKKVGPKLTPELIRELKESLRR